MSSLPCSNRIICVGPQSDLEADNPVINFSSEATDGISFTEMQWPITDFTNPFTPDPGDGLPVTCTSPISQDDAELCAIRNSFINQHTSDTGPSPTFFFSNLQSCAFQCPDGTTFLYTVNPGAFVALNQSTADQKAAAYACKQVALRGVCSNITAEGLNGCLSQPFLAVVSVAGGFQPYTITLLSGSPPPGVGFVQDSPNTAFFSGTPGAAGIFDVTVQAMDAHGNAKSTPFAINILGFSNTGIAPSGLVGTPYGFQLNPVGGTPFYIVSLLGGTLPDGLTMDATGNITGTPTTNSTSSFDVQVEDSTGNRCQQTLTLVIGAACNTTTPWSTTPGTCRLKIYNYVDGMFLPSGCPGLFIPGSGMVWDGTFSVYDATNNAFHIDPKFTKISGFSIDQYSFLQFQNGQWILEITCKTNLPQNGGRGNFYQGFNFNVNPTSGSFNVIAGIGCAPGPSVTLEGYQP